MSEAIKNIFRDKKENIIIGLQVIVIPIFFWFDARIGKLEQPSSGQEQRIFHIEKKVDHLIELMEKNQEAQMQFYKDYSPALDFSKRQLEKK